jgi:hypothetical protein
MSPIAEKRPLDEAAEVEVSPVKYAKVQFSSERGRSFAAAIPTPHSKVKMTLRHDFEWPVRQNARSQTRDTRACDEAVSDAIRLFKESFLPYMTDRYVKGEDEEDADELAEKRNTERYQDVRKTFMAL